MSYFENNDSSAISPQTIQLLNEGSRDAFDQIFHAYQTYLCRIAVYYIHDSNAAQELVDDVFLALWKHHEEVGFPIINYLKVSVKNACLSYLRTKLYRSNSLLVNDEDLWDYVCNTVLTEDDFVRQISSKEATTQVKKAMDNLPPKCRQIFIDGMFDNLTYQEIAKKENITESTARVQMKIALEKLRNQIDFSTFIFILLSIC